MPRAIDYLQCSHFVREGRGRLDAEWAAARSGTFLLSPDLKKEPGTRPGKVVFWEVPSLNTEHDFMTVAVEWLGRKPLKAGSG